MNQERPMECRVCGCTEFDPCFDNLTGEPCGWAPPVPHPTSFREMRPICTLCAELEAQARQAFAAGYNRPDGRKPLVELATEGDLDRLLRGIR